MSMVMRQQNMTWINAPEEIEEYFGFIYIITSKITGQSYIGKKQFFSITKKKVKGRKNKVTVKKESDWKTYTSSSIQLNKDILTYGIHNFEFRILHLARHKMEWDFLETKEQWQRDVLNSLQPDGTRKYFNGRIEFLRHNKFTADKVRFAES